MLWLTLRYADSLKKRMDLLPNSTHTPASHRPMHRSRLLQTTPQLVIAKPITLDSVNQLWLAKNGSGTLQASGEFEAMGSGGLDPPEKKLEFDFTESARMVHFSLFPGFFRTAVITVGCCCSHERQAKHFDQGKNLVQWLLAQRVPLSATLQFSSLLINSISSWPEQQADITRKDAEISSPFGWDTEPVMGAQTVTEEVFVDVFCDLVYGGGWIQNGKMSPGSVIGHW